MPAQAKPLKSSWMAEEKLRHKIESLEAYAIDACKDNDQKKTAGMVTCLTWLDLFLFDVGISVLDRRMTKMNFL